jgi:hypothetical protein
MISVLVHKTLLIINYIKHDHTTKRTTAPTTTPHTCNSSLSLKRIGG